MTQLGTGLLATKATPIRMAENPDIDVTPILNMFIILIPFLVSLAVFSHLSVLQFSLPADGGGEVSEQNQLPIVVVVTASDIAITRGELVLGSLPRVGPNHDFDGLTASLSELATASALAQRIVIAVEDAIVFSDVVQCMDHCRSAGFDDVALADTTGTDRTESGSSLPIGGNDAAN